MPEPEARSRARDLGAVHSAIDVAIAELDGSLRELSLVLHGHPELALAEDPDDHDLSPSCGSSCRPGWSETGNPAGWVC